MNKTARHFSLLDRLLCEADHALRNVCRDHKGHSQQPNPAKSITQAELSEQERKHSAGLMRVDHTGEVCAQALYRGQALMARSEKTRQYLLHAAEEENDHRVWCQQRLEELDSRPSLLNAWWYWGAFKIGCVAGFVSDKISLGFISETEKQVEAHLTDHLQTLPEADQKSRAILSQMREDEIRHAQQAEAKGGVSLPKPIKLLMRLQSKVMTSIAYYL